MTDITWRTASLPDATAGVPYEAGLAETGSATAVTASSVSSGSLPPGLSLSADHVRITGTPSGSGIGQTYTFKVTLTDTAGGVQSGSLSITIRAAADVAGHDKPFSTLPVVSQMASMWPAQF
jgi:Putative Ig domain